MQMAWCRFVGLRLYILCCSVQMYIQHLPLGVFCIYLHIFATLNRSIWRRTCKTVLPEDCFILLSAQKPDTLVGQKIQFQREFQARPNKSNDHASYNFYLLKRSQLSRISWSTSLQVCMHQGLILIGVRVVFIVDHSMTVTGLDNSFLMYIVHVINYQPCDVFSRCQSTPFQCQPLSFIAH